jgi:hypothetical protein
MPSPVPSVNFSFVGCYNDNKQGVMPVLLYQNQPSYVLCFTGAVQRGYRYVGLESRGSANQCFAANSLGLSKSLGNSSNCEQVQSSDGLITWGVGQTMALYDLGGTASLSSPTRSPSTTILPTSLPPTALGTSAPTLAGPGSMVRKMRTAMTHAHLFNDSFLLLHIDRSKNSSEEHTTHSLLRVNSMLSLMQSLPTAPPRASNYAIVKLGITQVSDTSKLSTFRIISYLVLFNYCMHTIVSLHLSLYPAHHGYTSVQCCNSVVSVSVCASHLRHLSHRSREYSHHVHRPIQH